MVAYREERSSPDAALSGRPAFGFAETQPAEPKPAIPAVAPVGADPQPDAARAAPAKPRSRKRLVLLGVLVVALMAGSIWGYRYWTEGRFFVSTDDAYVAADITILAAKVSGYVSSVEVTNNRRVAAGDVIARIDDGDYRLAVRSAADRVATLRSTSARIGSQIEAARAQVAQAEPQIVSARADRTRAEADFERQSRLAQSDFASKARYEQALADRDRAEAAVKIAEAALAVARANVSVLEAQRQEAERNVDEASTQLARAERDLSFTVIRAPVAGVVGNRAVEVGSYVQPGTRLAALIPLASVRVDANFKETQLAGIRPGQKVHLEVDAYPGRGIPAVVDSLAPASGSQFSLLPPENATGNFTKIVQRVPVRVQVDPAVAAEGLLRPGMSAVVRIDTRDRPSPAESRPDENRAADAARPAR